MDRRRARQFGVDAAVALLVFCTLAAAITARLDDSAAEPGWPAYALALVFAALTLPRRRYPVVALLVSVFLVINYHALGQPALPLALPVVVVLYSAAERGHLRWAVGCAVALTAVSAVARVAEGDSVAWLFGYDLLSQAGMMAATVALGDAVRSRRGWREQLRRQAATAAEEREHEAVRRVEQERLRIARELHDALAHALTAITLHSEVARETLGDEEPDVVSARRAVAAVREIAGGALRELRATVGSLRAAENPSPGLDRLDELADTAAAGGVHVELAYDEGRWEIPAVVASTAYRIVQEALTNVVRHAQASTARVEVRRQPGVLSVSISDDGRGCVAPQGVPGFGLAGMRERAELLGGRVDAGPTERGWVVQAVLPVGGPR
ncbi:sensor histidine kinase [Mycobacterium sp. PS03-16]|uniref:sensor histidine kinase n=1 Tax=Mycobacterium sp. PS03-16 TaxID=2559611 RepID=UPI001FD8059F|nr:sensor histidine kinase [Mycobacterium sp. PS03-16]